MPVIGLLDPRSPDVMADRLRAFRLGLKEVGYVEGENVTIIYGFAEHQYDRLPELAAELVRRQVTVIAASATIAAPAAKAATTTIPIAFVAAEDPVRLGLVTSLARPGGNLTGINFFSSELTAKRLDLLHELLPRAIRVAVLVNPTDATNTASTLRDVETAARAIGLQLQVLNASTSPEINAAFEDVGRDRPDALVVGGTPFLTARRIQVVQLAAFHRLPAVYGNREFVEVGGLMSYGTNVMDAYRQLGIYAGRIRLDLLHELLPRAIRVAVRCTGEVTFSELVDDLAKTYTAPREKILADVGTLLRGLAGQKTLGIVIKDRHNRAGPR